MARVKEYLIAWDYEYWNESMYMIDVKHEL